VAGWRIGIFIIDSLDTIQGKQVEAGKEVRYRVLQKIESEKGHKFIEELKKRIPREIVRGPGSVVEIENNIYKYLEKLYIIFINIGFVETMTITSRFVIRCIL
jgi:hypothetical protein